MSSLTQPLNTRARVLTAEAAGWLQENVLSSPGRLLLNLAMAAAAVLVLRGQLQSFPLGAGILAGLWLAGLIWVAYGSITHRLNAAAEWLKERLYNSPVSALTTLVIVLLIVAAVRGLLSWAVFNASFSDDPAVVQASEHTGATWGVIRANIRLFMVGQLATENLWRVWASVSLVLALAVVSLPVYILRPKALKAAQRWVTWAWAASPVVLYLLLRGYGEGGLFARVETRTWGGLLFTMITSVFAIVASFPLGVLLALGRRSSFQGVPGWLTYPVVGLAAAWGLATSTLPGWPAARNPLEYVLLLWPVALLAAGVAFQRFFKGNVVSAFCTVYIEFVRGVPAITVLFMAQLLLPLFLPADIIIENAFRAMWGFMFFSAAYLAENVRGGLQSIAKGQYEASQALGLNGYQELRYVILPQALRVVIPPIVGLFIGLFKDTSLVTIVGLFDLLAIANSVVAQPDWLGLRLESYVFITAIYYLGCAGMAAAGRWLERRLGVGQR